MRQIGALFVLCLAALSGCGDAPLAPAPAQPVQQVERHDAATTVAEQPRPAPKKASSKIPSHALETLRFIRENKRAPDGFEGGRHFGNYERLLPERDRNGKPIKYREWDVAARVARKSRGAERIVTGSDGSAWYTADHYKSFTPME